MVRIMLSSEGLEWRRLFRPKFDRIYKLAICEHSEEVLDINEAQTTAKQSSLH